MTAFRVGLSSARLCLIAAILLAATACAASPLAAVSPSAKGGPASEPRQVTPSPGAKGGSPSPVAGVVDPSVSCVARPSGAPMVLVGQAIYEVADPTHPKLLCQAKNTAIHLFTADTFEYIRRSGDTGTEVVLHSMSSGNESVVAGWPIKLWNTDFGNLGAWTPDGNYAATFVHSTDANNNPTIQVWLFAQPNTRLLWEFPQPLTDCICRFGLPSPTLAFSADGQYLVAGWPIGKGAAPLRVFSVNDYANAQAGVLDGGDTTAIWSRTGHVLYASGQVATLEMWTPEQGVQPVLHGPALQYMAGLSPDGQDIVYTAYASSGDTSSLRVYDYNLPMAYTRMLEDQPRSEVTFVKDGWVWYFGEVPCADCPGGSAANGPLYARDVTHGTTQQVVFAAGESPAALQSGWSAGQFWPNS